MGGRSVETFFISCDGHYLAKNLSSIRDDIEGGGAGPIHVGAISSSVESGVSLIKSGPREAVGLMRRDWESPTHICM